MMHVQIVHCILCQLQHNYTNTNNYNYIYINSNNRVRIFKGKYIKNGQFSTEWGKVLCRNCLQIIDGKVFAEAGVPTNPLCIR